jgi:hypothetical protein
MSTDGRMDRYTLGASTAVLRRAMATAGGEVYCRLSLQALQTVCFHRLVLVPSRRRQKHKTNNYQHQEQDYHCEFSDALTSSSAPHRDGCFPERCKCVHQIFWPACAHLAPVVVRIALTYFIHSPSSIGHSAGSVATTFELLHLFHQFSIGE